MNPHRSEYESNEREFGFLEKMGQLLPSVEFEEPAELAEARTAVLEALRIDNLNPDFLRSIWVEYAAVCEHTVDNKAIEGGQRIQLQIAMLIHKALIFREVGDMQRYRKELTEAEVYSFNMHLDAISDAIIAELEQA